MASKETASKESMIPFCDLMELKALPLTSVDMQLDGRVYRIEGLKVKENKEV